MQHAIAISVLVLGVLAAQRAEAGACLGDDEVDTEIIALEKRARSARPGSDSYLCLPLGVTGDFTTKQRVQRINAACQTLLGKKPDDSLCIYMVGIQGIPEHGGVKIFDAVVAWNRDPWSGIREDLTVFRRLGDARAVPVLVERWKKFATDAASKRRRNNQTYMAYWSSWRQEAAQVLGALGGVDEATFLDAQAKLTTDRYVKRASTTAATMIRARLTK